jgi:hypothetical protein
VTDPSALSSRQSPKRAPARIEDLALLVRVPRRPGAIRAYTAAEQAEADAYAAAQGDLVEPLPSGPPAPRSASTNTRSASTNK